MSIFILHFLGMRWTEKTILTIIQMFEELLVPFQAKENEYVTGSDRTLVGSAF